MKSNIIKIKQCKFVLTGKLTNKLICVYIANKLEKITKFITRLRERV